MRIDLDHLRTFYEVVKAGNMTKAAENMNISQPSVSRIIQILEERLEVKLFERTPQGLMITLEGQRLHKFSKRFIEEAYMMQNLLKQKTNEATGELKVITSPGLGETWLASYVPGFLKSYPDMSLSIVGRTDQIDLGEADVAIRSFVQHHPELIQRHLQTFHMKLWASREYLEQYGTPKKPEDLDSHQLITFGDETTNVYANLNWILNVGASIDYRRTPYLQINSLEGLINFAKAGLGIVELAEEYVKSKNVDLIPLLSDIEGPKVDIYYIYQERMKNSKRVTALGDYLEEMLAKE